MSAEDKLVLVKHKPGLARRRILLIILLILGAALASYEFGLYQMKANYNRAVASVKQLSESYEKLSNQDQQKRQRIANLERSHVIDDLAKQKIQDTIKQLRTEVFQLRKEVSFYKNIMAPSDGDKKGLQIEKVDLKPGSETRQFHYKIVLKQVADNKRYVKGVVAVNFIGENSKGEQEIMPLRDISEVKELGIKFKFRYFQEIAGDLVLPEGFGPEKIQVVLQSKGKNGTRVEESFKWQKLLEKDNVGQAKS